MRLANGVLAVMFGLVSADAIHAQQALASTSVLATAMFAPRPTLTVSAPVLQFRIEPGATKAEATVEFTAAMRARPGDEVVLTIEAPKATQGPGGATDVDAVVTFTGQGDGVETGTLDANRAVVAARWFGGGQRRGRLLFTLRASAPGVYTMPVTYLLGTP
jgi:hypothetical protein